MTSLAFDIEQHFRLVRGFVFIFPLDQHGAEITGDVFTQWLLGVRLENPTTPVPDVFHRSRGLASLGGKNLVK